MKTGILVVIMSFMFTSCVTKGKKTIDPNQLVGAGSQDISSQDIDMDNRGSDGESIEGLSTVYFAYDSSGLSEETKDTLRSNLDWIRSQDKVTRVELEGHCDTMGSEAYNVGLGRRRAQAVKNFLVSEGLNKGISIISYGEERPLSETDHSKNRRVNFVPLY